MTDKHDTDVEGDVTLFKSASNNSYYPVYFNAIPEPGVDALETEKLNVDLRPERDASIYVEIYNPTASIPLVVTPGGMGEIDGFGGFARNVAAAAPDLKVIIWDRRNMGRSGINFGRDPLSMEEAEDLHVLIERLGVTPAAFYGMSSGARSNVVLAERYPDDVAALVIAPLTGGPTDEQLAALTVPATLILHHGQEIDYLHPITHSRAATTLIPNSTLAFAPTLQPILDLLLPFVREHIPAPR